MTKGAALHKFFSGFGMDAYAASSVPEDAVFPYLTHDIATDSFGGGEVSLTVNLWFYTQSEAIPNAKVQEIADAIGMGGLLIECDGGCIWLKRGAPFAQSLKDDTAPNIKRRYLNVTAEYLTMN